MSKVLVLEPDVFLGKAYLKALKKSELDPVIVQTAADAITATDMYHPDVVVMELQLGSHNGLEFLYELRSYPDLSDVKVVIYSRLEESEVGFGKKQREQLGVEAYCHKSNTSVIDMVDVVKRAAQQ